MSDRTGIEWADATWNPVGGCARISPGCEHCYAEQRVAPRLHAQGHPVYKDAVAQHADGQWRFTGTMTMAPKHDAVWTQPARWRKPCVIFPCSTSDLFHERRSEADIDQVFAAMAVAPQHRYLVLTKRSDRMREYIETKIRKAPQWVSLPAIEGRVLLPYEGGWPSYIWLGTSAEDQQHLARIYNLLHTPAVGHFVSLEPLLGPADLTEIEHVPGHCLHALLGLIAEPDGTCSHVKGLDWVIAGGESGPGARPMHPDWVRQIRDQCAAFDVPFHFKQWGAWLPWEPDQPPCWAAQNGQCEDRHTLFPADFDHADNWDDGLWALPDAGQAAFQRVGKKAAGRLLDGRTHDAYPEMSR